MTMYFPPPVEEPYDPITGRYLAQPLNQRFWRHVNKHGPVPAHRPEIGACWLWVGATFDSGYGRTCVAESGKIRNKRAHRLAYEWEYGPIPKGLEPDHLCRVRPCVRPSHQEPVTQKENLLRGESPAAANARKTHCAHGHPFDEHNTYWWHGTRNCLICRVRARLARART